MSRILNPHTFLGSLLILAALVVLAPAPGRAETGEPCAIKCEKGSAACVDGGCVCVEGSPRCGGSNRVIGIRTPQGAPVIVGPFGGDVSYVTVGRNPDHGNVNVMSDGSLLYAPYPPFIGLDSFTFNACNGSGQCEPGTVLVDVTPPSSSQP